MFWQLFRRLSELGVEIIVIPILGRAFRTLWWRYYSNPISNFSFHNLGMSIYNRLSNSLISKLHYEYTLDKNEPEYYKVSPFIGVIKDFKDNFYSLSYQGYWTKCLRRVWKSEKGIDAIFLFDDILHYMRWLPKYVHGLFGVPVVIYNAELPTYLWSQKSFRLSSLYNVDLSEYDAFIVNSKGVVNKLKEMGASNVYVLYFGADPHLFSPVKVKKDIDISFYGYGADLRENIMNWMITIPSKRLRNIDFRTTGKFKIDLGFSKDIGPLNFPSIRRFCCRSKITLNITRKPFAETYCSSTARPFELAAMQSCIVSNPCRGMKEWFTPGKEIFEASDEKEAIELYKWLLSSEETRRRVGQNARQKVCQKHTYKHRADEFLKITQKICS